jgi:hypothetical protein
MNIANSKALSISTDLLPGFLIQTPPFWDCKIWGTNRLR